MIRDSRAFCGRALYQITFVQIRAEGRSASRHCGGRIPAGGKRESGRRGRPLKIGKILRVSMIFLLSSTAVKEEDCYEVHDL